MILHITNGDCAGDLIRATGIGGEVLCWCDVLHDGPVPAGLSLSELTGVRAGFLASLGLASEAEIHGKFERRNTILKEAKTYGEVVLWFEHDLFDQLQLIQILDYFAATGVGWTTVTLIQSDRYLGHLSPGDLRALFPVRRKVTREQFLLAREAWAAFRAPDPSGLAPLFAVNPALPFLGPALKRFAAEYPSCHGGLSHTERGILELCAAGVRDRCELFPRFQATDEPFFLGDSAFWPRLDGLIHAPAPLLTPQHELTAKGRAALEGKDDRIRGNGIDRWLGGVHLTGEDAAWRWDPARSHFLSLS